MDRPRAITIAFIVAFALSSCGTSAYRPLPRAGEARVEVSGSAATASPRDANGAPDDSHAARLYARHPGIFVETNGVRAISARARRVCLLMLDGAVECFSADAGVDLHGDIDANAFAQAFVRVDLPARAEQIAVGERHACALLADRSVACWGDNAEGQLGDGTTTDRATAARVQGITDAIEIAAGGAHTCARSIDERVRCWGRNDEGQLGDGTRVRRSVPGLVQHLAAAAEIAAGEHHTCARLHDRTVFCWGDNHRGQLGCTSYSSPPCTNPGGSEVYPARVPELDSAAQLALGDAHSCARTIGGTVACWGARGENSGQLGPGRLATPALPNTSQISAGALSTCGVISDGHVRCWGEFAWDHVERNDPAHVTHLPGVADVSGIALGRYVTCVRFDDATARCFER